MAVIFIMYCAVGFGLAAALLQMAAHDNTVNVTQFLVLLMWVPGLVLAWPFVVCVITRGSR